MAEKYLQRAAAIAPQASFVVRNRAAFSQLAAKSLVTAIN